MDKTTRAFLGALIFALLVALILPAIFGTPPTFDDRSGGDPWRNFVYDFQTLITGVLAVCAAWATVHQMRRSDELQLQMHRALRRDSRAAEIRMVQRLLAWAEKVDRQIDLIKTNTSGEWFIQEPDRVMLSIHGVFALLYAHLVRDTLEQFADPDETKFMPLEVRSRFEQLLRSLEHAKERFPRDVVFWPSEKAPKIIAELMHTLPRLQREVQSFAMLAGDWATGFLDEFEMRI